MRGAGGSRNQLHQTRRLDISKHLSQNSAVILEQCHTRFHEATQQYIELLTNHIDKEDNILFNLGDQVMTGEDQSSLGTRFC